MGKYVRIEDEEGDHTLTGVAGCMGLGIPGILTLLPTSGALGFQVLTPWIATTLLLFTLFLYFQSECEDRPCIRHNEKAVFILLFPVFSFAKGSALL